MYVMTFPIRREEARSQLRQLQRIATWPSCTSPSSRRAKRRRCGARAVHCARWPVCAAGRDRAGRIRQYAGVRSGRSALILGGCRRARAREWARLRGVPRDPNERIIVASQNSTDGRFWKAGLFYFNPGDSALMVPKRQGFGYTLNFGRPVCWLIFALILLLPLILPLFLNVSSRR